MLIFGVAVGARACSALIPAPPIAISLIVVAPPKLLIFSSSAITLGKRLVVISHPKNWNSGLRIWPIVAKGPLSMVFALFSIWH